MSAPAAQSAPDRKATPPRGSAPGIEKNVHRTFSTLDSFWTRITDGLEIDQLWAEFKADATAGYRFYQKDIKAAPAIEERRFHRFLHNMRTLFWAILTKLSPVRRVMFLVALVLLVFPQQIQIDTARGRFQSGGFHFYGDLLLLAVLLLEIGDRVVMKRDLQIAREIQGWLVPESAPAIAGLDIAFVNRPANTVAGDYYDVFPWVSPDGMERRFMFVVADVAGKSIPAALLMATFQASLRSLCATARTLPELLAALNQYACVHSRGGTRFTTAFLGAYEPETREMTYVNAGHNEPYLVRANHSLERLDKGGLPVGIHARATYEVGFKRLEPGDRLLIYTDGLTEAVNARDEEFGEEPVIGWLATAPEASAQQMLAGLMAQLGQFTGATRQNDDITCTLVRVTP